MLSEKARLKKNEYQRSRYRQNRDRIRKQQEEYWERVAQRSEENTGSNALKMDEKTVNS